MKNLKILLVEDDDLLRETLKNYFEFEGHKVKLAEDAEEALKILKEEKYDLLITDIKMPEVSGVDLIKVIKNWGIEVPIVVLSASPCQEEYEEIKDKIKAWIKKPFSLEEIRNIATEISEQKESKLKETRREEKKEERLPSIPKEIFHSINESLTSIIMNASLILDEDFQKFPDFKERLNKNIRAILRATEEIKKKISR